MAPRMWKGNAESQFVIEARDANDVTHVLVLQPLSASYRREWECILPKTPLTKARNARFRAQSEEEAKRKAAEIARSWDLRLPGWKARPGGSDDREG